VSGSASGILQCLSRMRGFTTILCIWGYAIRIFRPGVPDVLAFRSFGLEGTLFESAPAGREAELRHVVVRFQGRRETSRAGAVGGAQHHAVAARALGAVEPVGHVEGLEAVARDQFAQSLLAHFRR